MDIISLEMRLRAEFAAPPALERPVAPPQPVPNPPAPEEDDYGVQDMDWEETPTVDLVVAEDAAVVAVSRKSLSLFVLFLFLSIVISLSCICSY